MNSPAFLGIIMYAIINISGKQYKASEGARVRVPKQSGDEGSTLTFNEVLLFSDGKNTEVGTPTVSGASVTATILTMGEIERSWFIRKKAQRISKEKWTPSMVHESRDKERSSIYFTQSKICF